MNISLEEKHTQIHRSFIEAFDDHRCLSHSEERKCMWTHGKNDAMWEFWRTATREGARQPHTLSGGSSPKLSCCIIFTMCSHTFTLFWMRKTSVIVKTQASMWLCVPFIRRSLHFLVQVSSFFSYFLIFPL